MAFAAMPPVPQVGLDSFIAGFMLATKQNVEVLTGQYGDKRFQCVLRGQISVQTITTVSMQQVTAKGSGVTISGSNVPTLADYIETVKSLQLLANDVSSMRNTLNALIMQLKG
jgi:hypothetical protein